MSVKVHDKIYQLRQDVENLQVEGLVGKLVLGWWLYPTKHLIAKPRKLPHAAISLFCFSEASTR